jgi:branched-chain amino acid aminotransferase
VDSEKIVYINGEFVPESEARVSVFDRGFLYGDGMFETMRSYGGRIFRLADHMRRLKQSADIIGLRLEQTDAALSDICTQLLDRNSLSDAILRISVTRGPSTGGIGISKAGSPTIVAFARPPSPLPAKAYTGGVSARIVSVSRVATTAIDSRVKSMNFLNYILARAEAERAGAYEAIMLDGSGQIAEASTGNIFFAKGDCLVTPSLDCDILPGITRATVIEIARETELKVEERTILPSELPEFSECFLTNSGVELLPVSKIDDAPVGNGRPGPIHTRLHKEYRTLARQG